LWVGLAGCAGPPEPIRLDVSGVRPRADFSDLAAVLSATVSEDGRVLPAGLKSDLHRLDRQLRVLAVSGPTVTPGLFPTAAARWAYWYNARVAWSLKLAVLAGGKARLDPAARRRPFPLDGRSLSLEEIDRVLLAEARRAGDFRLAACTPGVCLDRAPMPTKPYEAADFPACLNTALSRLVLDERRFVLDVERRQVRIPPMLWAVRDMVGQVGTARQPGLQPALIGRLRRYVGGLARHRLDEALGYTAVPQPPRPRLALVGPKVYVPGRFGRVELTP